MLEDEGGRAIDVYEWHPVEATKGTILFSHGASLAPNGYRRIVVPLAATGWRVLAPVHTDSEQHPDRARYVGLETWRTRIEDMRALADHAGSPWYAVVGHSFGALTALALGGAEAAIPPGIIGPLRDPRARAVVAFSPPPPIPTLITQAAYARLAVPSLIQTGTLDVPLLRTAVPVGWEGHLAAFEAAVPGHDRFALVLEGVDHYFGGGIGRLGAQAELPDRQLSVAAQVAIDFLDAYARRDAAARRVLLSRLNDSLPVRLLRK